MIDKQELINMDHGDLTSLSCDVLMALTIKAARENAHVLPDGFVIKSNGDRVKWTFDIKVKQEFTEKGKKDFDEFRNSVRIKEAAQRFKDTQLFKTVIHPGDLDES